MADKTQSDSDAAHIKRGTLPSFLSLSYRAQTAEGP